MLLFLDCAHFLQRCKILAPKASNQAPFFSGVEESFECTGQSEMLNYFNENTFLDNCKKLKDFLSFNKYFL